MQEAPPLTTTPVVNLKNMYTNRMFLFHILFGHLKTAVYTYGLIFYKIFTVRWSQSDKCIFVIDDSNCIAVTALLSQSMLISGKMVPVSTTTLANFPQHQHSSCKFSKIIEIALTKLQYLGVQEMIHKNLKTQKSHDTVHLKLLNKQIRYFLKMF
jgi:hypothetical protein